MTTSAPRARLNVLLKSILEPGDEVLVPSPFFPEYQFYADNHGGKLVPVRDARPDFGLDLAALETAISRATRMILVNAPNNPTGAIYPASDLARLGALLDAKAPQATLVADEPYRRLVYDDVVVPSILADDRAERRRLVLLEGPRSRGREDRLSRGPPGCTPIARGSSRRPASPTEFWASSTRRRCSSARSSRSRRRA